MKQELMDIGLSEKEAESYLVCLKTGQATPHRIAGLMGLPRSTTYDLLDKLRQKGFVTTFKKDKKTYVLANNPEVVISFLDEKKKETIDQFEDRKQVLKIITRSLKNIQNQIHLKPVAEVFEGKISVGKLIDEIAENARVIKLIGNQKNAAEKMGYRADRYRAKRKRARSKEYQLLEDSPDSREEKVDRFTEVRFLKSLKDSKDVIIIYDDVTVHVLLGEEISAIRVRSKEHTKAMEIVFDELWSLAKKR
ncbi:MAG: helix-turn-helix domain-containing protein [archaeon]